MSPTGDTKLLVTVAAIAVALTAYAVTHPMSAPFTPPDTWPRPARPITITSLGRDAASARLTAAQAHSTTALERCQIEALQSLGLLAPNQAVIEDGKPLLPLGLRAPNGLEAFYVPGTDTLFLLGSDNASIGHEYVHALEDQLPAGRMRTMASRTTTDGRIALRMAIEGTAEVLRGEPGEVFRSTSSFTGNALHLQYNVAPRILRQRGDTTLDRALSWAPTSVAAALGLSWAEREGTATPDGCTDQLGITGIATVIAGTPFQTKLTQIARTVAGDSIAYDRTAPVPSVSWHIFLRLSPETDSVRSMLEAALERKVSAPHAFTIHGGLVSDGGPTVLSNSGTP